MSMRVPTVLLAWELGLGAGHLANIRRVAGRLKPHGIKIVAVVPEPAAAGLLRGVCDEVLASPHWPARRGESSATFNDILAARGLGDCDVMLTLLRTWDGILDRVAPDLVIADLAPGAALAARGRTPLLLIGNGYTLPPAEMKFFPLLHGASKPQANEKETLDVVNKALAAIGRGPLQALPQIFAGDARSVHTFALLDPYALQREEQLDGPLFDGPARARVGDAKNILVYISGSYTPPPALLSALKPFAPHVHISAPSLAPLAGIELSQAGAKVYAHPIALQDLLPSSRLVIHSGGGGLACEALAVGVPQLILGSHIEQDLNGERIERAGAGRLIRSYNPVVELSASLVAAMLNDKNMGERADALSVGLRALVIDDAPSRRLEQKCLTLLGR